MANLRPFQIVLLTGSLMIFLGAIAFLALWRPSDDGRPKFTQDIMVWGTLDETVFGEQMRQIQQNDERFTRVSYKQFSEEDFIPEFVDALAERRGPDLIVLPHDRLVELRSKLYAISYETYPLRTYQDNYIEAAEIFTRTDGLYAIPFAVDPLVMYWNRTIFSNSNIALPPVSWEELRNDTVPRLTRTGGDFDIVQSAVALGEYRNIRNARAILSMLMLQAGSAMVKETNDGYEVSISLTSSPSITGLTQVAPSNAALSFYTEFANPASSLYSWNRSLPQDRARFLSGNLGLYFGFGSEHETIAAANPNLNFDMTEIPQDKSATARRGYGVVYGFAIPAAATNIENSYAVAVALGGMENTKIIAEGLDMAPVYRATLQQGSGDPYQTVRNRAALIARGWLEPSREATERAFQSMVEDVTSGRLSISEAVGNAAERLRLAF